MSKKTNVSFYGPKGEVIKTTPKKLQKAINAASDPDADVPKKKTGFLGRAARQKQERKGKG